MLLWHDDAAMENVDDAVDYNSADEQMIHFSQAPSLQSNSIHFISLICTGHSNVWRGCEQAGISNNSAPDKKKQLCGR